MEALHQLLDCTAQFNEGKVMAPIKLKNCAPYYKIMNIWTVFPEQLRNTNKYMPTVAGWDAPKRKTGLK